MALKISKLVWEPVLGPQDQDYPPIFDYSEASFEVKPWECGVPMVE